MNARLCDLVFGRCWTTTRNGCIVNVVQPVDVGCGAVPRRSIAPLMSDERAKIQKALDDLAQVKPGLTGTALERLEEIERALRAALRELA